MKINLEDGGFINLIERNIESIDSGGKLETPKQTFESHINKINFNLNDILSDNLDEFLMKGNLISKVKNFLFNNAFGSSHQLKLELINRFNCEDMKIVLDDKNIVDALLIKPRQKNEDSYLNTETNMNNTFTSTASKNLMMICGPNDTSYEYLSYSV